jgi:hypothetical protein
VDDVRNRYSRELIDAANAALEEDPGVRACRERARADGFELRIAVDAVVERAGRSDRLYAITAADRRFLRSLRIATDPNDEP